QFVFLTLGPGINYFDGPWRKKICALPGPRLIIDPAVVNLADAQIYPSYSIDPPEMGEGRLRAINRFQTGESAPCSSKTSVSCRRDALSMPFERREKVIRELADVLCRYGLLNDDPALERGFSFMGAEFRGNIVNNEIRLRDGLALREWAIGVIVPPGAAKSTRRRLSAIGFTEESGPGGMPLSEFVIEAPFATDAGFRLAYLELVLRRSQPVLSRIIRRLRPDQAPENGIRPGYTSAMHAIDRIIRREGFAFLFHRRSFDASRSWAEWRTAWSEWLEALIRGDDGAACERLRCRVGSLRSKLFCEGLPEDRQDHAQVNR
ncbi:MAG TPA: hypothetical protein PKM25_16830, partial [Candidatus Ozemobacteraceae bacterium]|nr:hypothetical protein [Candidatus Ozemobacteraceae bacterium]